jgi:hypothetical protein
MGFKFIYVTLSDSILTANYKFTIAVLPNPRPIFQAPENDMTITDQNQAIDLPLNFPFGKT